MRLAGYIDKLNNKNMKHIKLFESWLDSAENLNESMVPLSVEDFYSSSLQLASNVSNFSASSRPDFTTGSGDSSDWKSAGSDIIADLGSYETEDADYNFSLVFRMNGSTITDVLVSADIAEGWLEHYGDISCKTPEDVRKAIDTVVAEIASNQ